MCDSPEHYTRLGNALEHGCNGGGGTAQRRSSACSVPAAGTTYGPLELAQQDQGGNAVLTEGSGRAELPRGVAGDEGGRLHTDGTGEEGR
jgi:hypothetical protein